MTFGLYRTQEDGYSNRSSSYIAGAALWPTHGPVTLTTYLDGNTVNDDEPLHLRVAYYDPHTMTPYAGRTLRGLTLQALPNWRQSACDRRAVAEYCASPCSPLFVFVASSSRTHQKKSAKVPGVGHKPTPRTSEIP